ncbi:MAG: hypothetical protein ABEJ98_00710 [Candidatus Nanohaloarchaea archaeon]
MSSWMLPRISSYVVATFNSSIDKGLRDRFEEIIEDHSLKKSQVIEDLVEIYVEKREKPGNYHKVVREALEESEVS